MSDDEKKLTAFHEAGHAIIGVKMTASDPIHKATIIPRGRALGMVMRLPEADKLSVTREKMHADLAVAMGGRVAEELIFGYDQVTSGASSDIQQATRMAKAMVTQWGMSDKLGPMDYSAGEGGEPFLGATYGQNKANSEDTAALIDSEVRRILDEAYELATKLLKKHSKELDLLANALLEYETLTGDEIDELLKNGKIVRSVDESAKVTVATSALPSSRKNKAKKNKSEDKDKGDDA